MKITIMSAVKIMKETDQSWSGAYISSGDNVVITDYDGRKSEGRFLFMDLGKDVEEDDVIIIDVNGKNVEFQCSYIKNIEVITEYGLSEENKIYEDTREHLLVRLEQELEATFTNSPEEYEDGMVEGLRTAIRIVSDYFKTE